MSDYIEELKKAYQRGYFLDDCGCEDRIYDNGVFYDTCGMSVEDFMDIGGGTTTKKSNTVTFTTVANSETEYELVLTVAKTPNSEVIVNYTIDGVDKTSTIPAGTTYFRTGVKLESKYASISNITISSSDESYKYTAKNNVSEGIFTLTYKVDGNVYGTPESIKYGTIITEKEEPTKTGYTFSGWQNFPEDNIMPEHDVVVTGEFAVNRHKITYTISGDVYQIVEDVAYGTTIKLLPNPSKVGYQFSGWQTSYTTMPDSDIEITGTYKAYQYTLTFMSDESVFKSITQDYESEIDATKIGTPTKEGYKFSKWDKEIPATMPLSGDTLNAIFEPNTYKLTLIVDGTQYGETKDVVYGSEIKLPTITPEVGYTFAWDSHPEKMPAHDLTISGNSTPIDYTLNWYTDDEGKNLYSSITKAYKSDIPEIEDPDLSSEGYDFSAWTKTYDTMPLSGDTIYAIKTKKKYLLTVNAQEDDKEVTTVYTGMTEWGEDVIDYSEIGITSKTGFDDNISSLTTDMPKENMTVLVHYTRKSYYLTYILDGEQYGAKVLVPFETDITTEQYTKKAVVDEHYDVTDWDFSGYTKMPAYDITATAYSTPKTYTLTYKVDDKIFATVDAVYKSSVTAMTTPLDEYDETFTITLKDGSTVQKLGQYFNKWEDEPTTVTGDAEIDADIQNIDYYISWVSEGESLHEDGPLKYGDTITAYTIPEEEIPEGKKFSSWSGYTEGDTVPALIKSESNIIYNAIYSTEQYILKIDKVKDSVTTNILTTGVTCGQDINPIIKSIEDSGLTVEGYSYKWNNVPEGGIMPDVGESGSIYTITINYTKNSYTLTINKKEGEEGTAERVWSDKVLYNESLETYKAKVTAETGYVISWDSTATTMPASDFTLTATITEKKESTTIYYGVMLNDSVSAITESQALALTSGTTASTKMEYSIPYTAEAKKALDDYNEEEIDDDEYYAILKKCNYALLFIAPSSNTFADTKLGGLQNITLEKVNNDPFVINGSEYNVYKYQNYYGTTNQTTDKKDYFITITIN